MVMRSYDKVLLLSKEGDGKDLGLIDPRLFEGKNRLHVLPNEQGLWHFKYDHGVIPPSLRNKFTSFNEALAQAKAYFSAKKITIVDVLD